MVRKIGSVRHRFFLTGPNPTQGFFTNRSGSNGYYCYRSIISLDVEKRVPIRVQVFDREDRLIEDYGYEDLTLNAGLTDADFDPRNPKYKF